MLINIKYGGMNMEKIIEKYRELEQYKGNSLSSKRLCFEFGYAIELCKQFPGKYERLIHSTLDNVLIKVRQEENITKGILLEAENNLEPIKEEAKKFEVFYVAHAHIDMNWRWRYDETVAITLDTFRTMLNLIEEYPDFKFSQSQASCYEIVEKYDKKMLEEIKKRVGEGRWEITASQWVEGDKNMPSSEGLSRQLLYAKKYLSKLFKLGEKYFNLDFEPDTFGHSAFVPDVLNAGGVKYYYHCRGYGDEFLYRWKGQGNSEILVYRDPLWYLTFGSEGNHPLNGDIYKYVMHAYERYGFNKLMRLYGVGDHGGGPSRADIEMIKEMSTWPIFPKVRFATMKEYYEKLEEFKDKLPVVQGELNPVFTGCYTSQSRIKMANRIGERSLVQAETYGTLAEKVGYEYDKELIESGWRKVLFNHFHDILPGSGIIDTREHSMGTFQEALAASGVTKKNALRSIVEDIDTEDWIDETPWPHSRSEGAGVGYGVRNFKLSQVDRSKGLVRVIHIFNSTAYNRKEIIDAALWHYPGNVNLCEVYDSEDNKVPFIIQGGIKNFEGYDYYNLSLEVSVPAYGYATYLLTYDKSGVQEKVFPSDPRKERVDDLSFENKYLKGYLTQLGQLAYLENKITGEVLIKEPQGGFKYVLEDPTKGMTAWVVGNYLSMKNFEDVRVKSIIRNPLRTTFEFEMKVSNSSMTVKISLDACSPYLEYDVNCHWREIGSLEKGLPQLQFSLNHAYETSKYIYEIPFGVLERNAANQDLPAVSFTVAKNNSGSSIILLSDTKSGFRGYDNNLSLTLIRSSVDPDPYPEIGVHDIKFAVGVVDDLSPEKLIKEGKLYQNKLDVLVDKARKGVLPKVKGFLKVNSDEFTINTIKKCEEDDSLIIRGISYKDLHAVTITFDNEIVHGSCSNILEENCEGKLIAITGNKLIFEAKANEIITLKVKVT
jgi:alpha-mannosidase